MHEWYLASCFAGEHLLPKQIIYCTSWAMHLQPIQGLHVLRPPKHSRQCRSTTSRPKCGKNLLYLMGGLPNQPTITTSSRRPAWHADTAGFPPGPGQLLPSERSRRTRVARGREPPPRGECAQVNAGDSR
jgi:hypothetical protein